MACPLNLWCLQRNKNEPYFARRKTPSWLYITTFVLLCCSALIVLNAYIIFTIADNPKACFNSVQGCEVLSVIRGTSASGCKDVFVYTWKLPNSDQIYSEEEEVNSMCDLSMQNVTTNSTLQVGKFTCFRIQELFSIYHKSFNCAELINSELSSANGCNRALAPERQPQSNNIDIIAVAVILILLMVIGALVVAYSFYQEGLNKRNYREQARRTIEDPESPLQALGTYRSAAGFGTSRNLLG